MMERDDGQRRRIRYRWLTAISEHLSEPTEVLFNQLKEEFGELPMPDIVSQMSEVQRVIEKAPLPDEQLKAWSVEQIVQYCRNYLGPEEAFGAPSKEGLAELLMREVSRRPTEFAAQARFFRDFGGPDANRHNPRYVHALFRSLDGWIDESTRTDAEHAFASEAIRGLLVSDLISLIEWVARQQPVVPHNPLVPTWTWVQRSAAWLLLRALERAWRLEPGAIQSILVAHDREITEALAALLACLDPAGEADKDPIHVAINSVRGTALQAVVALQACWAHVQTLGSIDADGLKSLRPAVRHLIEGVLAEERHPAVRCILGWKLNYICSVDPDWAMQNRNRLFPTGLDDLAIWRATWDAYVGFNSLYIPVWEMLRQEYELACRSIGQRPYEESGVRSADEHLGAHIFLAWFLRLEGSEELLALFLEQSTDEMRGRLVSFGSRVISANISEKGLPPESDEWKRIEEFWNGRVLGEGRLVSPPSGPKEQAAFVDWVRNTPAKLPDIRQFIEPIIPHLSGHEQTWLATQLLEYLCGQFGDAPLDALFLIDLIADHAWPQWETTDLTKSVREVLENGQTFPAGRALVQSISLKLVAQHRLNYRNFLSG